MRDNLAIAENRDKTGSLQSTISGSETMDRLDAMAMFVAAVEEGSLARAARRLGRSPASITRGVALLEARAGERLLHRSSRSLKLTDAGHRHLAAYSKILDCLVESPLPPGTLGGRLTLTAPEMFGRLKVMPVLDRFLSDHPDVTAHVLLVNRVIDMVEQGIDLAVRIGHLHETALTTVRLGAVQRLVCASPAYLENAGAPENPGDLARHACIDLQVGGGRETWQLHTKPSRSSRLRTIAIGSRISVNSQAAALDMALRGKGICHPLSYQVAQDIADGRLVRLLPEYEPAGLPVHFVFHPSQRRGGLVRAFVEQTTPELQDDLAEVERALQSRFATCGISS
jgi:DNA-binding transcriptional LysR family regulator